MRGYVKRINQKASKLSNEQLLSILNTVDAENENLYSIFDSISTGIMIVDNEFILQQTNAILESQLPLISHVDDNRNFILPVWEIIEDKDIALFFEKCFRTNITNCSEEFSITANSSTRFLHITMMPQMNQGNLIGRIFMVNDITESRKQEILLHRMENLSSLTNLAAGMAHEIKNPLGAISIHIQLIQKAIEKARNSENILPPPKFVENHIDVVNEEIEHLNSLVGEFLLAVKPVNANLELQNPVESIKKIIDFFEPEFKKDRIEIQLIENSSAQKIMLDKKLFRDVIVNLLQNAIAAIKTRFPECNNNEYDEEVKDFPGKCAIETGVAENKFIIRVTDNGCGMSAETISKIFEPYFTTKANGTGLGMTMVYKIVKEFSGEISVHSKQNEGTSFIMVFPLPQNNKKLLSQNI